MRRKLSFRESDWLDFSENSMADGKATEVALEQAADQTVKEMALRAAGDKAALTIENVDPA
ncbi:hypothetical protein DPMN_079431 [Dreissena polymorpha]|uniref:Uncharacterized protein n=1 Tax=Dreissena polymorpha TaxID=45954 RepID=A0A9D3YT35_DREPO|nr:hypothetical protein DPMN_079431 [Dreissena polymorpha]